jgi:hypothetical protein
MTSNSETVARQPTLHSLNASGRTGLIKSIVLNSFQQNLYDRTPVWPDDADPPTQLVNDAHDLEATSLDLSTRPAPEIVSAKVHKALLKCINQHHPSTSGVIFRSASTSALPIESDAIQSMQSNPFIDCENLFHVSFQSTGLYDSLVDESSSSQSDLIDTTLSGAAYEAYTYPSNYESPETFRSHSDLLYLNVNDTNDSIDQESKTWSSRSCELLLNDDRSGEAFNEELYDDCEQLNTQVTIDKQLIETVSSASTSQSPLTRARLARAKSLNFHSLQQLDPLPEEDTTTNSITHNSIDCLIDLDSSPSVSNSSTLTVRKPEQDAKPTECPSTSGLRLPASSPSRLLTSRRNALLRPVGRVAVMLERLAECRPSAVVITSGPNGPASDNDSVSSSLQQRCDESGYESDGITARIESQSIDLSRNCT